jgi:hypothetical protein
VALAICVNRASSVSPLLLGILMLRGGIFPLLFKRAFLCTLLTKVN